MRFRVTAAVVLHVVFAVGAAMAQTSPAPAGAPTYTRDIAPIFFSQCTTCHRPGEVAPMSLLTYKDARPWAKAIATQVASGAMPPWHADPAIGTFANARRLTDGQKATIARWVAAGAPEGDAKDLPPAPTYAPGWQIGQPDAVLTMQEDYPIPARGEIPYVYFEVPANYDEDRWIKAWEVRPGNPAAVHHVIVYVRPPAEPQPAPGAPARPRPRGTVTFADGMDIPPGQTGGDPLPAGQRKVFANARPRPRGTAGSIGGFVPGNSTRVFPEGTAMRLPWARRSSSRCITPRPAPTRPTARGWG